MLDPDAMLSSAVPALTAACPLHVVARPGQRINVTLYSLAGIPTAKSSASLTSKTNDVSSRFCPLHVFVKDGSRRVGSPLCALGRRERHVYRSRHHDVTIHFDSQYYRVSASFVLEIEGKLA